MPKQTKIAIFTQDVNAPSEEYLVAYCKKKGITVDLFPLDGSVSIQSNYIVQGYSRVCSICEYAFCYGRTWGDPEARQLMRNLVQRCMERGLPSLDSMQGIELNHSKSAAMNFFAEHSIPTPNFFLLLKGQSFVEEEIAAKLSAMGVTKQDEYIVVKQDGSGGAGVHFLPIKDDSITAALQHGLAEQGLITDGACVSNLVIQAYLPSKDECNRSFHYRAITVGPNIATVLKFTAPDAETLASNISNGASASIPIELELSVNDQAEIMRVVSLFRLGISGVDFVFDSNGKLQIFEVNNSPGLATAREQCGIEEHYRQIVEYFTRYMRLNLDIPPDCIADVHSEMFVELGTGENRFYVPGYGAFTTIGGKVKLSDDKHARRSCCYPFF